VRGGGSDQDSDIWDPTHSQICDLTPYHIYTKALASQEHLGTLELGIGIGTDSKHFLLKLERMRG
jgi:hypothetical protein